MRRVVALAACLGLLASACGGSSGSGEEAGESTPATDSYGNPVEPGHDWSGAGRGTGAAGGSTSTGAGGDDAAGGAGANGGGGSGSTPSTVPFGCAEGQGEEPPPDAPGPLADTSSNDFALKAVMTPIRGDAGTEMTIEITAVAAPDALVAIVASFYDSSDHGMRAAKFTDEAGRARFKGPIPADAPVGWAAIAVSVTTRDERSAVDIVNFVVTGEGCP